MTVTGHSLIYGLIHAQTLTLYSFLISERYFFGSGNASGSHVNEHQSYRLIQLIKWSEVDLRGTTHTACSSKDDLQAVEVEDADRAITVPHPLEEGGDGILVVRCGEGRGEVEAERPCRWEGGAAGHPDVVQQCLHSA